ncbi:MAG: hypothetical protein ACK4IX_09125, partial [Candidatus Sericytochromatia bacterium]
NLPSKLPPLVEEKGDKQLQTPSKTGESKTGETLSLPNQAPKTPVLNKNVQTFSNLLMEIGLPNTPQNNQIAQSLANYGQPINKPMINQIAQSLGHIMNQGQLSVEAGVVLALNNIPVTEKNVEAVKQMLTGGGLSQGLISFNKDIKKLSESFANKDFVKELTDNLESKDLNKATSDIKDNNQQNKQTTEHSVKSSGLLNNASQAQHKRIEESARVIKNPDEQPEQEEGNSSNKNTMSNLINNESKKLIQESIKGNLNPNLVISEMKDKTQKLSQNIQNLLTIDVLKNPSAFPQQIGLLKKYFSEIESDSDDLMEILKKAFPELLEGKIDEDQDDNIFVNMLKLMFDDGEQNPNQIKNKNALKNALNASEQLKEFMKSAENVTNSMSGREILTKANDCLCIPIPIYINGKVFESEIVIQREDQSNKKTEIGDVPLKIKLSVETQNMGKVAVDINNLKKDLQVFLNVENNHIKDKVERAINKLQLKLEKLPFEVQPVRCSVMPKTDQSPSILLPPKYKVMSMNRIDGIV